MDFVFGRIFTLQKTKTSLRIIQIIKDLYLANRTYYLIGLLSLCLVVAYFARVVGLVSGHAIFSLARTVVVLGFLAIVLDGLLLFITAKLAALRSVPPIFSLGDNNKVRLLVQNVSPMPLSMTIRDEVPEQFQWRNFKLHAFMLPGKKQEFVYEMRPTSRGEYVFHDINIFARSILGLLERRFVFKQEQKVPVYPSILQMKKYELMAVQKISTGTGIKKVRKIGHSYEFEQIRNYVKGDDYRSINWKATSRRNELMVNEYTDEKSQQIFCVLDKSRAMRMPFNNLTLLDHAINTSLVISNIALKKSDRAGLLTFSDRIGSAIQADNRPSQIKVLLEALYKEKERTTEANFELLYAGCRKFVRRRSLLLLFTNFESHYALQRALPLLRKINKLHLLVVIFFENTEVADFVSHRAGNVQEIYHQTIARKMLEEKKQIQQSLSQFGIQSILTRPEELSVNTINKYMELKSRGMI